MSKNKTKFEVFISKSVSVQLWGDIPTCTKHMVDGDKHGIRLLYSYGMLQVVNVLHMALFFEGPITRKTWKKTSGVSSTRVAPSPTRVSDRKQEKPGWYLLLPSHNKAKTYPTLKNRLISSTRISQQTQNIFHAQHFKFNVRLQSATKGKMDSHTTVSGA